MGAGSRLACGKVRCVCVWAASAGMASYPLSPGVPMGAPWRESHGGERERGEAREPPHPESRQPQAGRASQIVTGAVPPRGQKNGRQSSSDTEAPNRPARGQRARAESGRAPDRAAARGSAVQPGHRGPAEREPPRETEEAVRSPRRPGAGEDLHQQQRGAFRFAPL